MVSMFKPLRFWKYSCYVPKQRVLGEKQLSLLAENEEQQKEMVQDVAKAMKADVVKMKSGDYIVLKV